MDDVTREEEAVRAALLKYYPAVDVKHSGSEPGAPSPELRQPGPRPVILVVAAAVLLVLAGLGVGSLTRSAAPAATEQPASGVPATSGAASPAPSGASAQGTPPTPSVTSGSAGLPSLPPLEPAPAGQRWVTYRDVAILVPTSWGLSFDKEHWYCAGGDPDLAVVAAPPYVGPQLACPGRQMPAAPPAYVTMTDQPEELPGLPAGATSTFRELGSVWIGVHVIDPRLQGEADAIVASATRTLRAANGCPVDGETVRTSRADERRAPGQVTSISVCQYRDFDNPRAGYYAGTTVDRATSQQIITAIQQAPQQAGLAPGSCIPIGGPVPMPLWLLVHNADGSSVVVVVNYDGCQGTGIEMGGQIYQLSGAACRPLFAESVNPYLTASPDERCLPR